MALLWLRALFHSCPPSVKTSHVTALGSVIAYLNRELVLYGHSGPWKGAGSLPGGIITWLFHDKQVPFIVKTDIGYYS